VTQIQTATGAAPAKSLPARVLGVLFAPRATYADVAAHPRWLGVLLVIIMLGGAATFTFLSTDVGKAALLDQQVKTMESFGVKIPEAAYDRMEQGIDRARYTGVAAQAVAMPLAALIVAGLAFAVFNAFMGGDGTFKQVYSVVAHSGVILSVSQLFGMPLAYARESMSGATNLAVFLPFLDENSFAARALGSVDLFLLWWAVSVSIGLGVLYKKRTGPIALTLIALYVGIGIVIAAIKTAVAGA
jgi:Yip1 domain